MAKQISDLNWEKRVIIISYEKQSDELFTKSIEKVSKASKIANKPLGFLDINQPMLAQFRKLGFSVLGYGHEVLVFQKALKDGIEMIKHLK